mmetsp:Transcript_55479/g.131231  ORF Transcript_55479/g.131231 Transcript_55479/m.131231 type:complete len:327 (+) Transcript_55479:644-1624(+)
MAGAWFFATWAYRNWHTHHLNSAAAAFDARETDASVSGGSSPPGLRPPSDCVVRTPSAAALNSFGLSPPLFAQVVLGDEGVGEAPAPPPATELLRSGDAWRAGEAGASNCSDFVRVGANSFETTLVLDGEEGSEEEGDARISATNSRSRVSGKPRYTVMRCCTNWGRSTSDWIGKSLMCAIRSGFASVRLHSRSYSIRNGAWAVLAERMRQSISTVRLIGFAGSGILRMCSTSAFSRTERLFFISSSSGRTSTSTDSSSWRRAWSTTWRAPSLFASAPLTSRSPVETASRPDDSSKALSSTAICSSSCCIFARSALPAGSCQTMSS